MHLMRDLENDIGLVRHITARMLRAARWEGRCPLGDDDSYVDSGVVPSAEDEIIGSADADLILRTNGNDALAVLGSHYAIYAGNGADFILGGTYTDTLVRRHSFNHSASQYGLAQRLAEASRGGVC